MNPYARYKSLAVSTSSTIDKIVMLFDEIIKLLSNALKHRESRDVEGEYKALTKASDIADSMRSGIKSSEHQLLRNMDKFLDVTTRKIILINAQIEPVEEVTKIIESIRGLRDAIATLVKDELL